MKLNTSFLIGFMSFLWVVNPTYLQAQLKTNDWYAFEYDENGLNGKVNLNGQIFNHAGSLYFNKNHYIFLQSQESNVYAFIDGVKTGPFEDIGARPIITSTGKYMFWYKKEGKYVVNVNGKSFGGYKHLLWPTKSDIFKYTGLTDNGNFYFTYTGDDEKTYLNVNGKNSFLIYVDNSGNLPNYQVLLDEKGHLIYSSAKDSNTDILYIDGQIKNGKIEPDYEYDDKQYISCAEITISGMKYRYINGNVYGPYDELGFCKLGKNSKGDFAFVYEMGNNKYVKINGKDFGPYVYVDGFYSRFYSSNKCMIKAETNEEKIYKYYLLLGVDRHISVEELSTYYLDADGNFAFCYKVPSSGWSMRAGKRCWEGVVQGTCILDMSAFEYADAILADSLGNELMSVRISGESYVKLFSEHSAESLLGPYQQVDHDHMKLNNGNYLFLYDVDYTWSKLVVNGKEYSLPEGTRYVETKSALFDNGNFGITVRNKSAIINGKIVKTNAFFKDACMNRDGRYLLRYAEDGKEYITIDGVTFGPIEGSTELYVGDYWKRFD